MFKDKVTPKANGTFIETDMVINWDDSKWMEEIKYLKEAKMHYIIMNTFIHKDKSVRRVYKTSIKDQPQIGNEDVVDACLRNCEREGIKVFLGIDYEYIWWRIGPREPEILYEVMCHGNMAIEELYKLYKKKYPKAFYGWYWPYEVDNFNFCTLEHFEVLAKALNINLDYMDRREERMPILISPFMNKEFSSAKSYAKFWKSFFNLCNMKKGDIFCLQDSIGWGGLNLNSLGTWFKILKKAVDTKKGLLFWSSTENFDHKEWNSAFLSRFIKQMELVWPFVDDIIVSSYSKYYSPNNIKDGFHKAYKKYILKKEVAGISPESPKWFVAKEKEKGFFTISFGNVLDKNIAAFKILCNREEIFSYTVQRKYGGRGELTMKEITHRTNESNPKYYIIVYDFWGNPSKPKKAVNIKN